MDLHLETDISRMSICFVSFVLGRYDRILKLVFIPDIGYDYWSDWYDSFVIHASSICYLGDFCKSENKKRNPPNGE